VIHVTLFRQGRIIDPANGIDAEGDLLVVNGRIAEVRLGRRIDAPSDARVVECGGMFVTPGLVDPHVHLREPGGEAKETIQTGASSAINGGFTTVCCTPNTNPPIDTVPTVRFVRHAAREAAMARVFVVAVATVGRKGE